ncbi:uncharacterized protein LOC117106137 isoform X2 [Anneissia japonica]|uniref:uncharacterized protein LOC117106137 isoform X2 n=1 Tax=Anneissia japonica TaxID=1529436 RepID=UPI001425B6CB|nr:uncharacterized protein LOC117106137 isoform X2 [Anneissia japonica]
MDIYLIILSVIAVIILLSNVFRGKESLMKLDMVCCVIFGAMFILFPGLASAHETNSSDGVFLHMLRASGCVLIGIAVVFYQVQQSADATVYVVLMMSRLVTCTLAAVCGFYYRSQSSTPTDIGLLYIFFHIGFGVLYIYFLLQSREWGGHTQLDTNVNLHLRIDFFVTLVFGIFWYAFPEWVLGFQVSINVTPLQEYATMLFAAFMIGSAIMSSHAPGFISEHDQRAQFQGRILQNTILLPAMIYAQVYYGTWTVYHIYFGMVGCLMWTINALVGFMSPNELEEVKLK